MTSASIALGWLLMEIGAAVGIPWSRLYSIALLAVAGALYDYFWRLA